MCAQAQACINRDVKKAHPVVRVLTGGDANAVWLESLADGGVADGIIRRCGLLNEPRLERLELLHVLDSLWDIPDL
jgi:hypothetical protein